ncbi:DUF1778 domain-containing protein [Xenorhabdus bakwenae]|uniref:type II toxin -antitoxin system TacA 1-like antitoxin n=1 Tax=Xenorhabdus bakwenae TaxID=3026967 RepID=UPI003DA09626
MSSDDKLLLIRAATLQHTNLTEFVVSTNGVHQRRHDNHLRPNGGSTSLACVIICDYLS